MCKKNEDNYCFLLFKKTLLYYTKLFINGFNNL